MEKNNIAANMLIVDDDKFIRSLLSSTFTKVGYNCVSVCSCKDAIRYLDNNIVNVLITDIHMETNSGIDLINTIRDENDKLPIIVVTGDEDIEIERSVREKGVFGFFLKPLELSILQKTVFAAVNQG